MVQIVEYIAANIPREKYHEMPKRDYVLRTYNTYFTAWLTFHDRDL